MVTSSLLYPPDPWAPAGISVGERQCFKS